MQTLIAPHWPDYSLLDSGNGKKLERFGTYTVSRPEPQAIWKPNLSEEVWKKADAQYIRMEKDQGRWQKKAVVPHAWNMHYNKLTFVAKLTPFKHTGIFPEQTAHWEWMHDLITTSNRQINVLNLFAYTGIASLVCANAGAKVTHVDASRSTIAWAKENQQASHLLDKPIRWILDDAASFVQREAKRNVQYDALIIDPPIFGHGPTGKTWKFHEHFPLLIKACQDILSQKPLFILVNAYAISASALMLENVLTSFLPFTKENITAGELILEEEKSKRQLSTGIFTRWQS